MEMSGVTDPVILNLITDEDKWLCFTIRPPVPTEQHASCSQIQCGQSEEGKFEFDVQVTVHLDKFLYM